MCNAFRFLFFVVCFLLLSSPYLFAEEQFYLLYDKEDRIIAAVEICGANADDDFAGTDDLQRKFLHFNIVKDEFTQWVKTAGSCHVTIQGEYQEQQLKILKAIARNEDLYYSNASQCSGLCCLLCCCSCWKGGGYMPMPYRPFRVTVDEVDFNIFESDGEYDNSPLKKVVDEMKKADFYYKLLKIASSGDNRTHKVVYELRFPSSRNWVDDFALKKIRKAGGGVERLDKDGMCTQTIDRYVVCQPKSGNELTYSEKNDFKLKEKTNMKKKVTENMKVRFGELKFIDADESDEPSPSDMLLSEEDETISVH